MSVLLYLILPYLNLTQIVISIQMSLGFTNQKISFNDNFSIIPLHLRRLKIITFILKVPDNKETFLFLSSPLN
jgi:hypothetical protein